MEKYQNHFGDWDDVVREFRPEDSDWQTGRLDVPEPEGLIVADYNIDGYEGDANVLWRNEDGTYGYVSAGHCSCYGLEGSWGVEELTKEMIERFIETNAKWNWSFWYRFADEITEAINAE